MKTVLVTGATSGIGLAVAEGCLESGYRLIGIGRNQVHIDSAIAYLKNRYPDGKMIFFRADLSEQEETEKIAREISTYLETECEGKLFGLVNNVGCVRSWYSTNRKGYEIQFALNHLASFVLTSCLMPFLIRGKGRILMTSSRSHFWMKVRWNDIMFEKTYHPLLAYKQSKLCNLLFALAMNQRYLDSGVRAYGIDPGLVRTEIGAKDTGNLVRFVWSLRKKSGVDPMIPAHTYLDVLNAEPALEGFYYLNRKPVRYSPQVREEAAERLFALSERLTGIRFGEQK